MSELKEFGNSCLNFRSFEWAKSGIFSSDGAIRSCFNLEFIVLKWDSDAFLAEDTPNFLYDVGNGFFLFS